MDGGWTVETGRYGERLVMVGSWSTVALDFMRQNGIREIELNYARGWRGTDYVFLRKLPELEAVEITDYSTDDIAVVNELPNLRYLATKTYCKTALEFSNWQKLEECALEWRPKARSLFRHRGIRRVFINKWNQGKDLREFSGMSQLETLRLYSASRLESLQGVEALCRLTWLDLARASKLTTLAGIESLTELRHLMLHTCRKVTDISPIEGLLRLRQLYLLNGGNIETIRPLLSLRGLEEFLFYESTNIVDGDLSPLMALPNLKNVAFMERPHYSLKRADLPA